MKQQESASLIYHFIMKGQRVNVEDSIKEIEKEIKNENQIHKVKDQRNMALKLFQKDYFVHLLYEDSSLSISKSQFEQLEIPMYPEQPVIILLGAVNNIPENLSYCDKIKFLYSVGLIIGRHLNKHIIDVTVLDNTYKLVLFIQPKELLTISSNFDNIIPFYYKTVAFLKEILKVIQASCRESLDASISFVISGEPCKWQDVSKKYYTFNQLLNYRIGSEIEMLLVDNEAKNNILNDSSDQEMLELHNHNEPLEVLLRQRNLDLIGLYLEAGQNDRFFETLSELFSPLKVLKNKNSSIVAEVYYKVSLSLLSYINRLKFTEKIDLHIELDKLMRMDKHESLDEAIEYIYNISKAIFMLQSKENKKRSDNAVDYIQKFVEEHLGEDLSLERLAGQVYLNSSYLSRIYKQVKGTNLSDFIDNARIKRAKELLNRENVKIYEVGKSVGYGTAASFTRFFKKMSGISPHEYHEACLSGKQKITG